MNQGSFMNRGQVVNERPLVRLERALKTINRSAIRSATQSAEPETAQFGELAGFEHRAVVFDSDQGAITLDQRLWRGVVQGGTIGISSGPCSPHPLIDL